MLRRGRMLPRRSRSRQAGAGACSAKACPRTLIRGWPGVAIRSAWPSQCTASFLAH